MGGKGKTEEHRLKSVLLEETFPRERRLSKAIWGVSGGRAER
jgi:hypothetical protein